MVRHILFSASVSVGVALATPAHAAVAFYDIVGTGEASVSSGYRIFLPGGRVQDSQSYQSLGAGSFTAQYAINLATAPVSNVDPNYTSRYVSSGSPNFVRSSTLAIFGGQEFGIVTSGQTYQTVQAGRNFPNFSSSLIAGTGLLHGQKIFTYHDNGRVKSETTYDYYNQFYTFDNTTIAAGGMILPRLASGSQQIVFSAFQYNYEDNGTLSSLAFAQRLFTGNGTSTLRIDSNATFGAPPPESKPEALPIPTPILLPTAVPEPTSWALLITGFALVGGVLRRRGKARPAKVEFA